MNAQVSHDIAAQYYANLPDWITDTFRCALPPVITAQDGIITIQCSTAEDAALFHSLLSHLEQYLPTGHVLMITR